MQRSCECHAHFLFFALPSSTLRCSFDIQSQNQIAE